MKVTSARRAGAFCRVGFASKGAPFALSVNLSFLFCNMRKIAFQKSCLEGRHVFSAQSSLPGLSLLGNPDSQVEE